MGSQIIMGSDTYTLLNKDGDAVNACYIEILSISVKKGTGSGRYVNYAAGIPKIINLDFKYNPETQMLEGYNRGNKFTMRLIMVGGSVVGLAVEFSHMPGLTSYFAFNITEDIVYDIFAPPVHFEEMEEVEF